MVQANAFIGDEEGTQQGNEVEMDMTELSSVDMNATVQT